MFPLGWLRGRLASSSELLFDRYFAQNTPNLPRQIWTNFWSIFFNTRCTTGSRYITPRALGMTSLSCGEAGSISTSSSQSTGSSNWYFCKGPVALSSFTDWATLRSCFLHPQSLHCPQTVEAELARELEIKYSKTQLENDQIQNSIHQS